MTRPFALKDEEIPDDKTHRPTSKKGIPGWVALFAFATDSRIVDYKPARVVFALVLDDSPGPSSQPWYTLRFLDSSHVLWSFRRYERVTTFTSVSEQWCRVHMLCPKCGTSRKSSCSRARRHLVRILSNSLYSCRKRHSALLALEQLGHIGRGAGP